MEEAYKFGCGRYIQEAGALLRVGEEAKRFGKKALILAGPTAWKVSEEKIVRGMKDAELTMYCIFTAGIPVNVKLMKMRPNLSPKVVI